MKNEPDFTRKLINSFEKAAEQKVISKGQFLIKEGEEEKNLYFVTSGAIRVFYLSEFEEQTIRLGYEGSFINSLSSFLKAHLLSFTYRPSAKQLLKSFQMKSCKLL